MTNKQREVNVSFLLLSVIVRRRSVPFRGRCVCVCVCDMERDDDGWEREVHSRRGERERFSPSSNDIIYPYLVYQYHMISKDAEECIIIYVYLSVCILFVCRTYE